MSSPALRTFAVVLLSLLGGCVRYPEVPALHSGACIEKTVKRTGRNSYRTTHYVGGAETSHEKVESLLLDDPATHAVMQRARLLARPADPLLDLVPALLLGGLATGVAGLRMSNQVMAAAGFGSGLAGALVFGVAGGVLAVQADRGERHAISIFNAQVAESGCPPAIQNP